MRESWREYVLCWYLMCINLNETLFFPAWSCKTIILFSMLLLGLSKRDKESNRRKNAHAIFSLIEKQNLNHKVWGVRSVCALKSNYGNIFPFAVMLMNNELAQRLANGRPGSVRPLVINKANDTTVPLNYRSPPGEVQEWLRGKGFSEKWVFLSLLIMS